MMLTLYRNLLPGTTNKHDLLREDTEVPHANKETSRCLSVSVVLALVTITITCICLGLMAADLQVLKNVPNSSIQHSTVISCYYNTPDDSNSSTELLPWQLPTQLCTHINVAFARVVNREIYLEQSQYRTLREVVKLKEVNPTLKVLLSVGGAGEQNGFSEMVADHASRKIFIKSIKSILRNYSLDGVDLDWEFPAYHSTEGYASPRERQHFSQLLREIRAEYVREKREYLLTVAVAAPQTIADVSYDVDQINMYADFANIMTYDYHYYSKFTPFTGLNSPLYARASERLFLATLNVNYTVHMYLRKGLDRSKMVVGIPTYGHTFQLVNERNAAVGSPARGPGALGGHGFVDYPVVCAFRARLRVPERWERSARVPYLARGPEWVSYDSPRSVAAKAAYVAGGGLRGAMLYSLNADDHRGTCAEGGGRFPLARAVRRALPRQTSLPVSSSGRR